MLLQKEKQKTLEGTLNVKALQEKVDEVMEEVRSHRQPRLRETRPLGRWPVISSSAGPSFQLTDAF